MIKRIYNVFFFSIIEKKLYKDFYINKKKTKSKDKSIVLVQCVEDYFYFGLFGKIIMSLKEKKEIQVEQYVVRNLKEGSFGDVTSFIKSIFFANRFRDNKWIRFYSSYCDNVAYRLGSSTSLLFSIKALYKAYGIYKNITTKKELLSLVIEDIEVGDLIYDSYLRFKPAPTVDLNDLYLFIVIFQSVRSIEMTKKYFNEKKPKILLTSYSTYIQHGIAVRVAILFDTKIYLFGINQSLCKLLTKDDWFQPPKNSSYKDDFENLTNKEVSLEIAKTALESRLDGFKDSGTYYMKESAYKKSNIEVPYVKDYVVIFLHDFYDSPHVYGKLVFADFLDWVECTIDIFEKNNIPYCLKPHPNQIRSSTKVIDALKIKYPTSNFISQKITNKQLVDGGMKVGISVYGTVAHELAYMGIPVILCGDNPHRSYDFCYEARTEDEYTELIKNYNNLSLKENYKKDVESFYYMHFCNISDEMRKLMSDIILLRQLCESLSEQTEYNKYLELLAKISINKEFENFVYTL